MPSINEVLTDNRKIQAVFPASTVINRGDLLWWDSTNKLAKQASTRTDLGTLALNQADFAPLFLGVMQDQRLSTETTSGSSRGSTNALRIVTTDGVFDCACASQTWKIGDLVGIDRNSGVPANYNQQVNKVTGNPNLAIGIVIQEEDTAVTVVRCRLTSRIAYSPWARLDVALGSLQGYASASMTDANQTLTVASKPIQYMTPTANRTVTLPAESQSGGLVFAVTNNAAAGAAAYIKVFASDGATVIGYIAPTKSGEFWCDGTTWRGTDFPQSSGAVQNGNGTSLIADANTTITVAQLVANQFFNMVPTAARTVTLPLESTAAGLEFRITNNSGGANSITIAGTAAVKGNAVVPQNKTGIFWCDGTNWNGLVSA